MRATLTWMRRGARRDPGDKDKGPLVRPLRLLLQARAALYAAAALAVISCASWLLRSAEDGDSLQGPALGPAGPASLRSSTDDESAFKALLLRVFQPDTARRVRVAFRAEGGPAGATSSYFSLQVKDNELLIGADGVASACSAVQHYCLQYSACTTTWGVGKLPRFPRKLRALPLVKKERKMQHVYYMNFCTLSYTMAFWDWPQWERELDWMALHGVTMPLITIGREVVMRKLLREQGLADEAILAFFTGPAFLAWHRMGNLKGFAGPLPQSYLEHSDKLARRVLARARELGMRPVLPGFSGHVPDQLQQLFPSEKFSRLPLWSGFSAEFSGLLFVEPTSDLYVRLGRRFVEIQTDMFGTDHFYAVDQFNENNPRSREPDYLEACSRAQLAALQGADARAVWVLQGWLFVNSAAFWGERQIEAYLRPIPRDHVLVLDLISEARPVYDRTRWYHGKPFLWSVLHNFGGQVGMRGNLQTVMDRPYAALEAAAGGMVGVGLTMEAINQNPVVYELALDHTWNSGPRDLEQWLRTWVRARYGYLDANAEVIPEAFEGQCYDGEGPSDGESDRCLASRDAQQAWHFLLHSCYSAMDSRGNGRWGVTKSVVEKRPSMRKEAVVTTGFQESTTDYDACDLVEVWLHLSQVAERAHYSGADLRGGALELDLLDLSRQVLANHAQVLYLRFAEEAMAQSASADALEAARDDFLQLLDDLDSLLSGAAPASAGHFTLAPWLRGAQAITAGGHGGQAERSLYAYNARNLVTLWGPQPAGVLADYSSRLWGGLIRDYYKKRWDIAMTAIVEEVRKHPGNPLRSHGADAAFAARLWDFEETWQRARPDEGTNATGDVALDEPEGERPATVEYSVAIFDRYHPIVQESCREVQ